MRKTGLLLLVAALGLVPGAVADGMLDPAWGNGGIVTTNFPEFQASFDEASVVVVLPDGRAVAAGHAGDTKGAVLAAARYLPSGALDTTFAGDGRATVPCQQQTAFGGGGAAAALLQPDGRLVLVGSCPMLSGQVFWLARLNGDGSLDQSFGTGGQVLTPFAGAAFASAAVLQPDGRIIAVGSGPAPSVYALKAARYNPDGSLDPTFGSGGQVTLAFGQNVYAGHATLQPDGKLVIGGTYGPQSNYDFAVVRLLPNGAPDPSFSGDGLVTSDFGAMEYGGSVMVLVDGRLVLAGVANVDFALVRYLPDGTLDTSFGIGGLATVDGGGPDSAGQAVQLPNGKLLVAGTTSVPPGSNRDFLLARFHADGALDTSFGSAGLLRTDIGHLFEFCYAVAIAGPDLILAAGFTSAGPPTAEDFVLARYIMTTPVELLSFAVE